MHHRQNLSRVKIGQNRANKQNLFILSLIYIQLKPYKFSVSVVSRVNVAKLDFTIFAVDKMNRNASWNLNQTASYPLYRQPNSVRRCYVPTHDDQFGYPHVAGRCFENRAIFQTCQLTISMWMQQARQKLWRQNLSLDFATANCDFVCWCGSALRWFFVLFWQHQKLTNQKQSFPQLV